MEIGLTAAPARARQFFSPTVPRVVACGRLPEHGSGPPESESVPNAFRTDEVFPLLYDELRSLAAARMARESPGQTLQATALVHEAWLRLSSERPGSWETRGHFFAAAAETMRRILVDRARRRRAAKRGGGAPVEELEGLEVASPSWSDSELLVVNEALDRLAAVDPRKAELVKLRYFVGMNFEEAAEVLGIAVPTAKLWWSFARAWLSVEIRNLEKAS